MDQHRLAKHTFPYLPLAPRCAPLLPCLQTRFALGYLIWKASQPQKAVSWTPHQASALLESGAVHGGEDQHPKDLMGRCF